jgi:hypothetical protein
VIAPEPQQVGALHRFGHRLFRLLQPSDERRTTNASGPLVLGSRFSTSWIDQEYTTRSFTHRSRIVHCPFSRRGNRLCLR